jgi:hypothetical protein
MPAQQRGRVIGASMVLHVLSRGALGLVLGLFAWSSAAQVRVSSGGSPNYSQPIAVPPGISGMQPNLTLAYSGGGVNGPVGHGWSVQGISMITRCPATRYTDGAPRGVGFAMLDRLCLDGQRLIWTDAEGAALPDEPYIPPASLLDPIPVVGDAAGRVSGWREYRTENDSYARIRAYGTFNGGAYYGPAYFKVWTKAGQIYEYGANPVTPSDTNATITARTNGVVAVWAVRRISDVVGNYIDFKYEVRDVAWGSGPTAASPTLGRELNIAEIQYTGSGSQLPANKVIFRYSDRTLDRSEAYQQGSKNVSIRRLDGIDSYVNSANPTVLGPAVGAVKVRSINLTYDNTGTTKRSRLAAIAECTGAATPVCQPPTRFSYTTGGNESFSVSGAFNLTTTALHNNTGTGGAPTVGVMPIDFDGDGRVDLLRWSDTPALNQLWRSNGDGSFAQVSAFNITDLNLLKSNGCFGVEFGDFDGDGLTDLLRFANAEAKNNAPCAASSPRTVMYRNLGTGSFQRFDLSLDLERRKTRLTTNTSSLYVRTLGRALFVFDVDGDGKTDIIDTRITALSLSPRPDFAPSACEGTSACTSVYSWQGNTFVSRTSNLTSSSLYVDPPTTVGSAPRRYILDINGDGLQDIILNPYFGWKSSGDGNFTSLGFGEGSNEGDCTNVLDFNGDGREDCLMANTTVSNNKLQVGSGLGNALVGSFNLKTTGFELAGGGVGTELFDLNADGRTDILRWKDDATQNRVYLSNGDGSFTASGTFNLTSTTTHLLNHSNGATTSVIGDFLGNGTVQILRLKNNPTAGSATANQLYVKTDPTPPDQLVSVIGPTGLRTTLTYGSLADASSGRYTNDRSDAANRAAYPLVDLTIASPVVITMTRDVGVGTNTLQTQYAYKGLKAALDGRGMLGFRQVVQSNKTPTGGDLSVWTDYLLNEPYAGVTRSSQTRLGAWNAPNAQLLSTTTNTYCDRTSATNPDLATEAEPCTTTARVRRPYLRKTVESGNDLDGTALPTVTTTNTYNDYGDPTNIVVSTTGTVAGVANQTTTKATANTFCAPDSAGCPNKIAGDNWILGRITRATVTNTVPNLLTSITASPGNAANATAISGTLAGAAQPALALSNCSTTSPTTAPTAATMSCTVSNSGQAAASSISYTTAGSTTVSGPTGACAAGATCGTVTVTTGTTAATYSGTLTATPNAGTAASQAISLVVNAASGGWTFCSIEGNSCDLPATGNYTILYAPDSASAQSIALNFSNVSSVACNSTTFGGDPAFGVVKQCFYKAVSTSPALALSNCSTTSPTTAPTAATMSCTVSNSGQAAASSISYTTAGSTTVSGPTGACAAGATCGTVTVTTGTTAATYSGTLTATPNAGTAASQAISLVVNAATPPGAARDFTLASNGVPMAAPFAVAVAQPVTVVPAASGAQYSVVYWGDGTNVTIPGGWSSATPISQMTRAYSAAGTYTIEYATQIGGTWDSRTVTLTVAGPTLSPALSLSGCTSNSPTTAPAASTMSCTLSNTGSGATSSISYATATNTTVSGPTGACAAGATCGTVTVTTASSAGTYSGTLTATPNAGTAASRPVSLVVSPASVVFTSVGPTTTTWTFTNPNSTAQVITARGLQYSAGDSLASISGGTCTVNASIAPNATCTVTLRAPAVACKADAYSVRPSVTTGAGTSSTGSYVSRTNSSTICP